MTELTATQQQTLDYLIASVEERGFPPTFREIMSRFGIKSTNAVTCRLRGLERKGRVKLRGLNRCIQITGVRWKMVPLDAASADTKTA